LPDDTEVQRLRELSLDYIREAERREGVPETNEQVAIDLGRRLLFQIEQRADQGLPPKSKSFAAVIEDYIRFRERDHRHGGTSAGDADQA
jgi:hypothetical protein